MGVILLDVSLSTYGKALKTDFSTFFEHLLNGRVKTARGGSDYKSEIAKCSVIRDILIQLKDAGRLIDLEDSIVDDLTNALATKIKSESPQCVNACDDPHLFALGNLSGAKHVLSADNRIGTCRRHLNQSNIPRSEYCQLKVISDDKNYLTAFNRNFS